MNPEQLTLEQKDPELVKLFNQLLRKEVYWDEGTSNQPLKMSLHANSVINVQAHYVAISLSIGTINMDFAIHDASLLEWINTSLPLSDFTSLSKDIVITAIYNSFHGLWAWLENTYASNVILKDYSIIDGNDLTWQSSGCLSLNLDNGVTPALKCLCIGMTTAAANDLLASLPQKKPNAAPDKLSHLNWPVYLSMGLSWLTVNHVKNLQAGDIIFFEKTPEKECLFGIILSTMYLTCRLVEQNKLHVEKIGGLPVSKDKTDDINHFLDTATDSDEEIDDTFLASLLEDNPDLTDADAVDADTDAEKVDVENKGEEAGKEEEEGKEEEKETKGENEEETVAALSKETQINHRDESQIFSGNQVSVDTLPVLVSFDIGSTTIPLDDLQSLSEGYCFELAENDVNYITLRVRDQTIGKGQLIKIGERLGVEVGKDEVRQRAFMMVNSPS